MENIPGTAWAVFRNGEVASVTLKDLGYVRSIDLAALCMTFDAAKMAREEVMRKLNGKGEVR